MDFPELFLRCLKVVLRNEGGFSNHPSDPGKATMHGVTQTVYDAYRVKHGEQLQGVGLISDEEVNDIYFHGYWVPMELGSINNDNLVLDVYDMGINSGIRMAIKILQRLVGEIDDGFIGAMTLQGIRDYNGDVAEEYKKRRKLFYVTLAQNKPELRVFLKGWLARVDKTIFV
jgi:lysozyme family protein